MTIEIGSKVQGKVTGITKFGAFIGLPGNLTGLVHISEVADSYVKDVNDHLKVGDQIEVKVLVRKTGKFHYPSKKLSKDLKDNLLLILNAQHARMIVLKTSVQRAISNQRKLLKIKWLFF